MAISMVQLGSMTRSVLDFEVQSDLQMSHLFQDRYCDIANISDAYDVIIGRCSITFVSSCSVQSC